MSRESPSLLIVDSFALLFRGYYAMAMTGNMMQNSKGLYTNGLYQFTRYLLDAIRTFRPSHVVCAFDMGKETFRNELYPQYKANRESPPAELVPQFAELWNLVEAFNIPGIGKKGYEADDVIGSLSQHFSTNGVKVNILTGDGDTLQLINENTEVTLMKKGFGNYQTVNLYNLADIKGISRPYHIIEMKALMGDPADNIPGCPQVGPKTALKLIDEFDTIDRLFAEIDQVQGKLKERLIENKEQIYLSRDLATIRTNVSLDCSLDDCVYQLDRSKLLNKLEELEFHSIIRSIA